MKKNILKIFTITVLLIISGFTVVQTESPHVNLQGKWAGKDFGIGIAGSKITFLKKQNWEPSKLPIENYLFLEKPLVNNENNFESWAATFYTASVRGMDNVDRNENYSEYKVFRIKLLKPDKISVEMSSSYPGNDGVNRQIVPSKVKSDFEGESERERNFNKLTFTRIKE